MEAFCSTPRPTAASQGAGTCAGAWSCLPHCSRHACLCAVAGSHAHSLTYLHHSAPGLPLAGKGSRPVVRVECRLPVQVRRMSPVDPSKAQAKVLLAPEVSEWKGDTRRILWQYYGSDGTWIKILFFIHNRLDLVFLICGFLTLQLVMEIIVFLKLLFILLLKLTWYFQAVADCSVKLDFPSCLFLFSIVPPFYVIIEMFYLGFLLVFTLVICFI